MAERVYLKIKYDDKNRAKECGAKWDGINKDWYVANKELFMLKFTRRTKLQRKLDKLHQDRNKRLQSIAHNKNEDIRPYSKEYDLELHQAIYFIDEEIDEIEKQIKNDHDLEYYIKQEESKPMLEPKKPNKIYKSDFFL